jgi:hypothetical protein
VFFIFWSFYYFTRFNGGRFQLPFIAASFGQYNRMIVANGPFGAGNQLASLFFPGDSF